jgi:hypothetical protein
MIEIKLNTSIAAFKLTERDKMRKKIKMDKFEVIICLKNKS